MVRFTAKMSAGTNRYAFVGYYWETSHRCLAVVVDYRPWMWWRVGPQHARYVRVWTLGPLAFCVTDLTHP